MKKIFISYRRNGGLDLAGRLSDRLKEKGYSVFLDIESMRSGPFNEQIYEKIGECDVVLLVLPPKALGRCVHKNDWVRLEIEYAVKCQKKIIPIFMNGFKFPLFLPETLRFLKFEQGITPSAELFNETVGKLVGYIEDRNVSSSRRQINDDQDQKKKRSKKIRTAAIILSAAVILPLAVLLISNGLRNIKIKKENEEYYERFSVNDASPIDYYFVYDNKNNDPSLRNAYEKVAETVFSNLRESDRAFLYSTDGTVNNDISFDNSDSLKVRFEEIWKGTGSGDPQGLTEHLKHLLNSSSRESKISQCIVFSDLNSEIIFDDPVFDEFNCFALILNYGSFDITINEKYKRYDCLLSAGAICEDISVIPYFVIYNNIDNTDPDHEASDIQISFPVPVKAFSLITDKECSISLYSSPETINVEKYDFDEKRNIYRFYSDEETAYFGCIINGKGSKQIITPRYNKNAANIRADDINDYKSTFMIVIIIGALLSALLIYLAIRSKILSRIKKLI